VAQVRRSGEVLLSDEEQVVRNVGKWYSRERSEERSEKLNVSEVWYAITSLQPSAHPLRPSLAP